MLERCARTGLTKPECSCRACSLELVTKHDPRARDVAVRGVRRGDLIEPPRARPLS